VTALLPIWGSYWWSHGNTCRAWQISLMLRPGVWAGGAAESAELVRGLSGYLVDRAATAD